MTDEKARELLSSTREVLRVDEIKLKLNKVDLRVSSCGLRWTKHKILIRIEHLKYR